MRSQNLLGDVEKIVKVKNGGVAPEPRVIGEQLVQFGAKDVRHRCSYVAQQQTIGFCAAVIVSFGLVGEALSVRRSADAPPNASLPERLQVVPLPPPILVHDRYARRPREPPQPVKGHYRFELPAEVGRECFERFHFIHRAWRSACAGEPPPKISDALDEGDGRGTLKRRFRSARATAIASKLRKRTEQGF